MIHTHQNAWSSFTQTNKLRIKRFLLGKSSKSRVNKKLDEDILLASPINSNPSQRKAYTQHEATEIKRILSKKEDDYYGILDISNHALTYEKMMNAHRKLALRVHPDKINAPGATEAIQRLNKARTELMKKFGKQNNHQQTIKTLTTSSSNENAHREDSDINDQAISITTNSVSSQEEISNHSTTSNISNYLLLALVVLIIALIILIIYRRKRRQQQQYQSNPSNDEHVLNTQHIASRYNSPDSNGDGATSEISNI